jgi:hypothetical protein
MAGRQLSRNPTAQSEAKEILFDWNRKEFEIDPILWAE